jgi:hypothetical protein
VHDTQQRDPKAGAFREVLTKYAPAEAACGAAVGIWAATTERVAEQESAALLAVAVAAVGLLAVALTAMTLVITFLDGFFADMVKRYGAPRFFRPFVVVVVVSAGATVVGLIGAIDSSTGPTWTRDFVFGVATWLFVWAVAGTVRLVFKLVFYANARASIEDIAEDNPPNP